MNMLIKTIPVGQLETNCYVVSDEDTMECAVIDPGDESNAILDYLEDNHLKCSAILITHGHYDHVGAVLPVMEETGAPVYINEKDSGDDYQGGSKLPKRRRLGNFIPRATRSGWADSLSGCWRPRATPPAA
jgi:glyoxylase-like metal-dependent hydrolase (beta-lactamase superfamily II)